MLLKDLIQLAIREDMPDGDLTTESLALGPRYGQARLIAKEDLVLSGRGPFEATLLTLEPGVKISWLFQEGDTILKGQTVCTVQGDLMQILKGERVALNFLGHLSGIASLTRCYVEQVAHTKTNILDTRKTLPAYRKLEKKAVIHGGGLNHRRDLSEAVLIKDNHITVAGGITEAVQRIRQYTSKPIEVETRTLEEVAEAVTLRPERILLDNMDNETLRKAVEIIPAGIETEASGNMTLERVRSVAEIGVHFISVGALTHSAPCADFSLMFDWPRATKSEDTHGVSQ